MARDPVYLDFAASAPVRTEALAAEAAYEASRFAGANPNSLHTLGREAAQALEGARRDLARALGGGFRPQNVTFTSGGTESDNLAVFGLAEAAHQADWRRTRVVMSAIEHEGVLACQGELRRRGFEVVVLPVGPDGRVDLAEAEAAIDGSCALVSVMYANNETGVIQPVDELGALAHAAGVAMHTDAVQAFGHVPLALGNVDAVSVTAHKLGGPVGTGALALRPRLALRPQSHGGGQESGKRSGTQDVRGALAFAAAARAATADLEGARRLVAGRAEALRERLAQGSTRIHPTVEGEPERLPGTVSVYVKGAAGQDLVLALDAAGFEVSAGSACSASNPAPSHVLTAMGLAGPEALGSLRVSFDERVPESDLAAFADALLALV